MEVAVTKESYDIVKKLAYKFANNSLVSTDYDTYLSVGLEGLISAVKTYKGDCNTSFSSYATTCILNEMRTIKARKGKRTLVQDENVAVEDIQTKVTELQDDNFIEVAKRIILKANNGKQRNAEIFMLSVGLLGNSKMDNKELADKFNMTTERIRQICKNTRKEIKKNKKASELLYSFIGG